jgi:site-specific DNA-cytosine methylase
MKKIKNVFSCFDGISSVQIALNRYNISYDKYYSSEIDKHAIKVTQTHFPNTIQLGDIRNLNGKDIKNVDLFVAGSPCTDFSIMGKKKGMVTSDNQIIKSLNHYLHLKERNTSFTGESFLFWEAVRLLKEIKPKYFIFENVLMNQKWIQFFDNELGVKSIKINSSLLSAQNRERLYWTNIPNITVPNDKGILLSDILPDATAAAKRGVYSKEKNKYLFNLQLRKDGKANCLVKNPHTTNRYVNSKGDYNIIPPEVAEQLQTIDPGYTNVIPKYKRYQSLGNSMTVDVIGHIISNM